MIGKDVKSNNLYVSNNLTLVNAPRLSFRVHQLNWINGLPTALIKNKKNNMNHNNNNNNNNVDDDDDDINKSGLMISLKLRHGPTFVKGLLVVDSNVNNNYQDDNDNMIIKVYLLQKDKGEYCISMILLLLVNNDEIYMFVTCHILHNSKYLTCDILTCDIFDNDDDANIVLLSYDIYILILN